MPYVYEVSKCCSGKFDIWSKLVFKSARKSKTSDQGFPRECQTRSKGVPPRASEKQVAKTTRNTFTFSNKLFQNGNSNFKVWSIMRDVFQCFPHLFWDAFLMDFHLVLGSFLSLFCIFPNIVLKCTRCPQGSMVFEALALRTLMMFS